jgi:drug/metabolite transporter (DMT)-like permease
MLAIVLGVFAGGMYGAADFLGGIATKRIAPVAVTAISQSVGLAVLLIAVPFFPAHPTGTQMLIGLFGGLFGGIGIALLYHALSIGKMGVVSPITAVIAAAFPVIFGIVRGDALKSFQLVGIGVALVAVVMISLSKEPSGEREIATSGVKEAIGSGIAIGVFFLVLGVAGRGAGLDGLLAARVGSILFLLALAAFTRTSLRPQGTLITLLAVGVMDMIANVCFVIAAATGELAIAAVLTSLYPASTVFLARAVLNERLQTIQKIGVGLALIGVGLIAA